MSFGKVSPKSHFLDVFFILNLLLYHLKICKLFQVIAESFCSLVHHCFQLVYTDVMIDLIEDTIDKAILRDESISISSSKY